jgi:hypothetical protein
LPSLLPKHRTLLLRLLILPRLERFVSPTALELKKRVQGWKPSVIILLCVTISLPRRP